MRKKLLIIGTGFSGLAAAIKLKQEGEEDFLLLERSHEIGGVWRDNTYPGCACDVPSHLYSFSFAPHPDWTHFFARQNQIQEYLKDCVQRFHLEPHIAFNQEVMRAEWEESIAQWKVTTAQGVYFAQILVVATGHLSEPHIPALRGIETFSGRVFHSAQWPKDFTANGRNIVVVGTGASAVQFIPQLQKTAKAVTVFQRTPPWILPRGDREIGSRTRGLFRQFPILQKLVRLKIYLKLELAVLAFLNPQLMKKAQEKALAHLRAQVPNEKMREALTPQYVIGCKRILLSDDFYPALTEQNVTLVTKGLREVRPEGIVDTEGVLHLADTLIFGTGFITKESPMAARIFGKQGLSLSQSWKGHPQAHLGAMVSGFPNLFLMNGPNTGLGHSSMVYMYEALADHLAKSLFEMKKNHADIMEVRSLAQQAYAQQVAKQMRTTVWETGGCKSWYLDSSGKNSSLWPGYSFRFRQLLKKLPSGAYEFRKISKG